MARAIAGDQAAYGEQVRTRGIIGKLLHDPSVALRDAAGSNRGDRLVAALRELFALDDGDDTSTPA